MDGKRTQRRRLIAPAGLECLEGRQLMAAGAARVGFQEDASTGTNTLIISGTNKADVITIDDNGTGAAGAITIRVGTGNTYTTQSAIAQIELVGKGGNDQVTYNLNGDLTSSRVVLVDLGAGNDRFTTNLNGAINNANGLDLEVYGDAGNDTMAANQPGATLLGNAVVYFEGDAGNDKLSYSGSGLIASGASFSPEFSGGAGNDVINSNYGGLINGYYMYNLTADGGAGNDVINVGTLVVAGSTGSVGSAATSPAAVQGGAGNDKITYKVAVDPAATQGLVYAVALGNAGKDTVGRTANVQVDLTSEKTSLLS